MSFNELVASCTRRSVVNTSVQWDEINYIYAGKKVTVRYDKQDMIRAYVYFNDEYIGLAVPLNPGFNNNLPRNQKEN